MKKVSKPRVSLISKGEEFTIKKMEANARELLPKHKASLESVLVVIQGSCNFMFPQKEDSDQILQEGDSIVDPAEIIHQIQAMDDVASLHSMPNGIHFDFY